MTYFVRGVVINTSAMSFRSAWVNEAAPMMTTPLTPPGMSSVASSVIHQEQFILFGGLPSIVGTAVLTTPLVQDLVSNLWDAEPVGPFGEPLVW